jgi:hypothetical protein
LESADKKYWERLISSDNYLYFKSMMLKRNLQLEEEAMKLMIAKADRENVDLNTQSKFLLNLNLLIAYFYNFEYFKFF